METPAAALLALGLWALAGACAAPTAKCGVPQVWSPAFHTLRIVGGSQATYGSHPWLVSFRFRGSHFCGGAILTDRWVMTAAHCFASVSEETLGDVTAAVGEFDRRVDDRDEQVYRVKSVSVHERFSRARPVTFDIALVELQRRIRTGRHVQPVCLPTPGQEVAPQTSTCIVGGWGKVKERGGLPDVLREVRLNLMDAARCKYVLHTLKSPALNQESAMTVVCAGPEGGGRDACQGDSGGPLVCLAGSGRGPWVALGVTSWGKGCGRSWANNVARPPSRRGSPGVFTDVALLLPWIRRKLREADERQHRSASSGLCSVRDGPVSDSEGVIRNPSLPDGRYDNNELCSWSFAAPPGCSVLLEFELLDLENDSHCRCDRLTVSAGAHRPVGVFCGGELPGPLLLNRSATVVFSSDVSRAGRGFAIRHRIVRGHADPGCRATVVVEDQGVVHSPNYPQSYSNNCSFLWVVLAPPGHVVKLDVVDLDLEESERCSYDSLAVLADAERTQQIAVLCGGGGPPPVLSYHDIMVLRFTSDGSVVRRGFSATLTFISLTDLHSGDTPGVERRGDTPGVERRGDTPGVERRGQHRTAHVNLDASDPDVLSPGRRTKEHQGDVAPKDRDMGSDDEDHTGDSSGTDQ